MHSPTPPQPKNDTPDDVRSASFIRVLVAVCSSFLGIRKRSAGERDAGTIKPLHVIIAGLLAAAIFVALVVTLVSVITRKG